MEPETRLGRNLPVIRIIDRDYIIDWRLRELRMNDSPDKRIDLRVLDMDASGENYLCFYNRVTKEPEKIGADLTALPKGVVMLKIPFELKLDPVAVAREFGLSDKDLLKDFPIQKDLVAKVIPLKQTELPRIIKENKLKPRQKNRHRQKPG